ncbi:MAG TPA: AsnC family transcriptional regulator [Rhodocyclaceae bacterium]|nr:AsnC family transcriptional regulator [Rhodocyclaceae bacterium]
MSPVADSAPVLDALDDCDRRIINALQGDFPLSDEPYREVAATLGLTEADLLARLQHLLDVRTLTRFGPMFQIERMGGRFVLAAIQVPDADFDRIAGIVNALPEVAHNYRREHAWNMWFVLATERPEGIADAIARIETATGLNVAAFPKEREYFVEMKLHA